MLSNKRARIRICKSITKCGFPASGSDAGIALPNGRFISRQKDLREEEEIIEAKPLSVKQNAAQREIETITDSNQMELVKAKEEEEEKGEERGEENDSCDRSGKEEATKEKRKKKKMKEKKEINLSLSQY